MIYSFIMRYMLNSIANPGYSFIWFRYVLLLFVRPVWYAVESLSMKIKRLSPTVYVLYSTKERIWWILNDNEYWQSSENMFYTRRLRNFVCDCFVNNFAMPNRYCTSTTEFLYSQFTNSPTEVAGVNCTWGDLNKRNAYLGMLLL